MKKTFLNILLIFSPFILSIVIRNIIILILLLFLFFKNLFSNDLSSPNLSPFEIVARSFESDLGIALAHIIIYGFFVLFFGFWFKKLLKTKPLLQIKLFTPKNILALSFLGAFIQLFVGLGISISKNFFPNLFKSHDELVGDILSNKYFVLIFIVIIFLAPIAEELIFRGLVQTYATNFVGIKVAILLQAILFGIHHSNIIQSVYAIFSGIILGFIAYKFKSIIPAIILHIAVNLSSFLIPEFVFNTNSLVKILLFILIGFLICLILFILNKSINKSIIKENEKSVLG